MFRKLEFYTIYIEYLNESPFKYYISISRGVGGSEAMLILLIYGRSKIQENLLIYDTCTLPYG